MLILGKAMLLSPAMVDITQTPALFSADEALGAVNSGAHVAIDVSAVVPARNVATDFARISAAFPEGCVRAEGIRSNGVSVPLAKQSVATSTNATFLEFSEAAGADARSVFTHIRISSCRRIPHATVVWHNFSE